LVYGYKLLQDIARALAMTSDHVTGDLINSPGIGNSSGPDRRASFLLYQKEGTPGSLQAKTARSTISCTKGSPETKSGLFDASYRK
jgi:hypothetical protein